MADNEIKIEDRIDNNEIKIEDRIDNNEIKMSYAEAMDYIEALNKYGSVPGLDSIKALCARVGNPQDKLEFIHIAGTNGKGSVSACISYMLMAAGKKVGRYNSPVIREYRERICVGKQTITKEAIARNVSVLKEACDQMVSEGMAHPTVFEVETVLGFMYFVEKKCDYVVLECGMGGLMDATNLIKAPLLCVIASISMDHMNFLGDSLAQIAYQKAGIIKEGTMVACDQQKQEAMEVIEKRCNELSVPLYVVDTQKASQVRFKLEEQSFLYEEKLPIAFHLAGTYQLSNVLLAILAIQLLKEKGIQISDAMIQKGLLEVKWPGRFEVLSKKPLFIVDGAHNEDAAKKLAQTIRFYFTNKKIVFIMGILRDKEHEKIIEQTAGLAKCIITVKTPNNPRATDALELAGEILPYNSNVTAAGSIEEAIEMAYLLAGKEDVIISFGSLSYLGKVMDILEKRNKKK